MSERYALYFAPAPSSALWRLGSQLLGYDANRPEDLPPPPPLPVGMQALRRKAAATPARYGFHATLKPPMVLRQGCSPTLLTAAVQRFCALEQSFALPPLTVTDLRGFLALVPTRPCAALNTIANRVVAYFEPFRAPMSPADRARRKPETLDTRKQKNLDTWGYPYVFEDFEFHLTLSGRLTPEESAALMPRYQTLLADALAQACPFDHICIFRQPEPSQRFYLWRRFDLARHGDGHSS